MFTEDLTAFFNTDEHATAATYNNGTASTVNGIFNNEFLALDPGGAVPIEGSQPTFTCASADVDSNPAGDTLAVSGTTYTIEASEPDGVGVVKLLLRE
jgi:hypothetical protein